MARERCSADVLTCIWQLMERRGSIKPDEAEDLLKHSLPALSARLNQSKVQQMLSVVVGADG